MNKEAKKQSEKREYAGTRVNNFEEQIHKNDNKQVKITQENTAEFELDVDEEMHEQELFYNEYQVCYNEFAESLFW